MRIDYRVPSSRDCILMDVNNWLTPNGNLQSYRLNGKSAKTNITKVMDTNLESPEFQGLLSKEDIILVSDVASDVALMRGYRRDNTEKKYFNLPIQQIHGVFKNNKIDYENLNMLTDKILVKKLEETEETSLLLLNSNVMIGEVLKIGKNVTNVHVGDKILIKDNISTKISLNGETYYSLEERMVAGIFGSSFAIEDLNLINGTILMKSYKGEKVLNSKLLLTPTLNYEDLDFSDIHNRDLFQVELADKNLDKLEKNDIILVNRDYTNYVFYNTEKYFSINGYSEISAKIRRE